MLDKAFAVLALACFATFAAVLVVYVAEIDLTIVTAVVVLMAAVDFILLNRANRKPDDG